MEHERISRALFAGLAELNSVARIVSIEHVDELKTAILERRDSGQLDKELYQAYLSYFDFNIPDNMPDTASIIVVATPQPHIRLKFYLDGKDYSPIVPSTYSVNRDARIREIFERTLKPYGYSFVRAALPVKLLAVRSGLAGYGKNNITYVNGMGSLYRLTAYYSNLPVTSDSWGEMQVMEKCSKCTACIKKCPTGAINPDRFLIHAERCLTFHNEMARDFPEWLDPSIHHCLVGCLYCQKFCPLNKDVFDRIEDGVEFASGETELFLTAASTDEFPDGMAKKWSRLGYNEELKILARNLKTLIESPDNIM